MLVRDTQSAGPRQRRRARSLIAFCGIAASCLANATSASGVASSNASSASPPSPPGDLYQPPRPLPKRPPGTLIWAQKVSLALNPPATVRRILSHSRSRTGADIAVSGFALIPDTVASRQGRQVYAWAHGSTDQADRCAPSRDLRDSLPPYGGPLVARGVALVATDYQGLGTPGEPTTYDGIAEGHAILDSIRAIKHLPGVEKLGSVLIAGNPQGGGAALWAAELARS